MVLENIGEGGDALLCVTDFCNCCKPPYTGKLGNVIGNWFFPNGSRVHSSVSKWDFHRTRGHMVVLLQRRRGGAEGIYRCEIPDTMKTIYRFEYGILWYVIKLLSLSTHTWFTDAIQVCLVAFDNIKF